MAPWAIVVLITLVVVLGLAAFSDARDRRTGADPKLRAESIVGHRKKFRRVLGSERLRKLRTPEAEAPTKRRRGP